MMPHIEVLSIGRHIYDEDYIHVPESVLHLHALFELDLDRHVAHWFVEASGALFFPSLGRLTVEPLVAFILSYTFLTESCSKDGIVQLNITYTLADGLDARAWTELQLSARLEWMHLDEVLVGDSFFKPLVAPQADNKWLLPKLTQFVMSPCQVVPTDQLGDLLVNFVRTRISINTTIPRSLS